MFNVMLARANESLNWSFEVECARLGVGILWQALYLYVAYEAYEGTWNGPEIQEFVQLCAQYFA